MGEQHGVQVGPVMMFSQRRAEVVRFYADVAGLVADPSDDATWFEAANAKLAVHEPADRQTPPEVRSSSGFVVWLGVADVRGAFDRAKRGGAAVGDFHGDFFFARDPDGRFVGFYALEDGHGHDHTH